MLEGLQSKSDATKKRLAVLIAAIISIIILVIWIKVTYKETVDVARDTKEDGVAFWGKVKENIGQATEGIYDRFGNVKDQMGAIREYAEQAKSQEENNQ